MIGQTLSFDSLPLAATLLLSVAASPLLAETSADPLAGWGRGLVPPRKSLFRDFSNGL